MHPMRLLRISADSSVADANARLSMSLLLLPWRLA
jgi:hypothetical protein